MGDDFEGRISRLEADVDNMREGNKLFRDEIRDEMREIRKQNENIYKIATAVEVIATDLKGVKATVEEVKASQDSLKEDQISLKENLSAVITGEDSRDAKKVYGIWTNMRDKLLWLLVGGVASYLVYQALPMLKM